MHLMDGLMKDYYSIKYISSLLENRLGWPNNMVNIGVEPISRHFDEYFETDIKEAYRFVLLDPLSLWSLATKTFR
jgi:hypothetical protein